jgi:hypothetical protein
MSSQQTCQKIYRKSLHCTYEVYVCITTGYNHLLPVPLLIGIKTTVTNAPDIILIPGKLWILGRCLNGHTSTFTGRLFWGLTKTTRDLKG